MYRRIQYICKQTTITSTVLLFSSFVSILFLSISASAASLTQLIPITIPRITEIVNPSSSSPLQANSSSTSIASQETEASPSHTSAAAIIPSKNSSNAVGTTPITLITNEPVTPAGLVVNLFNNNTSSEALGLISVSAASGDLDTDNAQSGVGNGANTPLVLSSFSWYWIFLLTTTLVAVYYAYRNWQLSKG